MWIAALKLSQERREVRRSDGVKCDGTAVNLHLLTSRLVSSELIIVSNPHLIPVYRPSSPFHCR